MIRQYKHPAKFSHTALALLVLIGASGLIAHASAQTTSERVVEFNIPNHVPIKVRLKREKEQAIKDLTNASWYQDFQLEVTNTSDKPIYFLDLWLILPDFINPSGRPDGFVLNYGRMDFLRFNTRPNSTDIPIAPGSTYVFAIPEQFQKGWAAHKQRDNVPSPKKLELSLTQLGFGDGSGFIGRDARPFPFKD